MSSTRWIRSGARALRRAVRRAHRRAEPLPLLPFAVAFAMALVALVVSLEFRPPSEEAAAELEERPSGPLEVPYQVGFSPEEVEFEIVEYGIGKVVIEELHRLVIGVVVRNPYDRPMTMGALSLTAVAENGYPTRLEDFYGDVLPPQATVGIAFVASTGGQFPVEELRLEALESSYLYDAPPADGGEGVFIPVPVLPEATLLGTEPLLSPEGHRLRYRLDAPEDTEAGISVLFRDEEGRLLGGVPASTEPFHGSYGGWTVHRLPVAEGETFHYVDIPRAWMPEGADPDRFEVSPSA